MSFEDMKLPELRVAIKQFIGEEESLAVKSQAEARKLLSDEGVEFELYDSFNNTDKDEPKVEEVKFAPSAVVKTERAVGDVIVKMDRQNPTFQTHGYTFTREHPFVVMSEDDADAIFESEDGFRMATPKETREYYS